MAPKRLRFRCPSTRSFFGQDLVTAGLQLPPSPGNPIKRHDTQARAKLYWIFTKQLCIQYVCASRQPYSRIPSYLLAPSLYVEFAIHFVFGNYSVTILPQRFVARPYSQSIVFWHYDEVVVLANILTIVQTFLARDHNASKSRSESKWFKDACGNDQNVSSIGYIHVQWSL